MKAFKSYEAASEWWNDMSHDERRVACRAMGIGQVAAVDGWMHLRNDECEAVVKFYNEMVHGYEIEPNDVVILYPVN